MTIVCGEITLSGVAQPVVAFSSRIRRADQVSLYSCGFWAMRAPEEKETSDGSWLSAVAEVVVVATVVLLAVTLDVALTEAVSDFAGAVSLRAQPVSSNETRAIPMAVRGIHDSCRSLKTFRHRLY